MYAFFICDSYIFKASTFKTSTLTSTFNFNFQYFEFWQRHSPVGPATSQSAAAFHTGLKSLKAAKNWFTSACFVTSRDFTGFSKENSVSLHIQKSVAGIRIISSSYGFFKIYFLRVFYIWSKLSLLSTEKPLINEHPHLTVARPFFSWNFWTNQNVKKLELSKEF